MDNSPKPPTPQSISDGDWERARAKLVFYFSHRQAMNAQELAQETLARVFLWLQRGNTIEGEEGFIKTCFGFARNILHETRSMRRRLAEELPDNLSSSGNKTLGLLGIEASVFLDEALRQLSERDRELVLTAESVSQTELAEQMGVPITTLRVWVHRARSKLKKLLEQPS